MTRELTWFLNENLKTRELTWFDDDNKMIEATIVEIEKEDVDRKFDTYITYVECYGGCWEVWNIDGILCAYFEAER